MEVPYKELPRITRMKVEGKSAALVLPAHGCSSLKETGFGIGDGKSMLALDYRSISEDGYLLTLSSKQLSSLGTREYAGMRLHLSKWPRARMVSPYLLGI